ncbi:MAG: hypothetical protein DRR16_15345 [Candidatus Parabeggiatoa sp. nov. 3]|nr:MAG: hypothetical protein DRR16_15345 [Gammaproteobacteria bacterium]
MLLLTFLKDYPFMMDVEDANLDLAMQVRQNDIPPAKAKQIPPFVLLDIDNQTHKLWDEPLFTPRNKVKELIDVAVKGEARLIIVDIDLSQDTPINGLQLDNLQQHPYDKALYDYIVKYKTDCQGCPPIILDRAFRPLPESLSDGKKRIVEPRTSFLETAVAKSAPYIQWASPLFQQSSYDGAVRRWRLWESICTAEEKPDIIPSTQLLAAAIIRLDTPKQAQDKINAELARFKPKVCGESYIPQSVSYEPIKIAEGLEITEGMYGISQRIIYNMPWNSPQSIAEKWMMRYSLRDYDKETQHSRVILTVFSAQPYLESPEGGTFKDKIVVIGSSYSDGGDVQSTPLGTMPSGLVIINAIHSLLQYGEIKPVSAWNKGLAVLLIVAVSIILVFIESFWIVVFSGLGIILFVSVSGFLFGGIWINVALPLLAVYVFHIATNYHQIATKLKSRQQDLTEEITQSLAKQKIDSSELAKGIEQLVAKQIGEMTVRENSTPEESACSEGMSEPPPKKEGLRQVWYDRLFEGKANQYRALLTNMVVGLSIAFLLLYFNRIPWLMDTEDASMDWLMQLNQNIIPPIQNNNIPPVVVLDIDDKTYYDWGEPLFTPRERLKNMIKATVEAKARLVIVDLEVSQKTPVEGSRLHPDDQALKTYLESYIIECKRKIDNSVCPTIILKRTFSTKSSPVPILRTGFLDEVVAQGAPYVQWASKQFYPAGDQVVRRWKLWQPACTADNQPEVVPSIELLAMSLVKEDCITQDVQNALRSFLPEDCDKDYAPLQKSLPETFNLCGLPINTKDRWGINQRIMYRMSWLVDDEPPQLPYFVTDKTAIPVLTIFSAQPYTESLPQASLDALTDSIVVIGGSYREGRDIQLTPVGDMPGALLIVNVIHSVLQHEEIELSPTGKLLTTVLFLVILSILFGMFPFWWSMTISGILTIFVLLPLTMVFVHYGMWFNIALPLIVVSIYQMVAKYNQLPIQEQSLQDDPISSTS